MENKGNFIYEAGKYRRKPKIINFNLLSLFKMTRKDILSNSGTISHKKALEKAHEEYDKYMQNHLTIAEKDYLDMLNKEVFDIEK